MYTLLLTILLLFASPFVSSSELELKKLTNECCTTLCSAEKLTSLHDVLAAYMMSTSQNSQVLDLAHAVLGGKQCSANELFAIEDSHSKSKRDVVEVTEDEETQAVQVTLPLQTPKLSRDLATALRDQAPRESEMTGNIYVMCPRKVSYPNIFVCYVEVFADAEIFYIESYATPSLGNGSNSFFPASSNFSFGATFYTQDLTSTTGRVNAVVYATFYMNGLPVIGGYTTTNVTITNVPAPASSSSSTGGNVPSTTGGSTGTATGTTGTTSSYVTISCPTDVELGKRFSCELNAFSSTGLWNGPAGITTTSDKFFCENCFGYPENGQQYFSTIITFRAITVGSGDMFAYFYDGSDNYIQSQVVYINVEGSYITISCPTQVELGKRFNCQFDAYSKTGYWKDDLVGITTTSELFFCENCFAHPTEGQQYFSANITFRAIGVGSGDMFAYFSDNTTLYQSDVVYIDVVGSYININCPAEVELGKRFNCEFEAFSITGQWGSPVGITTTSDKFYCMNCFANPTEGEQYFSGFISFTAITVGTGDMYAYFTDGNEVIFQSKVVDVKVVGSYVTINCPEQVTQGKRFSCELNAYSSTGFWKDGLAGITTTSDLFFCENCFGFPTDGEQYFSANITFRAIGAGTGDMYAYFSDNTTLYQSETVYIEVTGSYIKVTCPTEVELGKRFNCEFEAFSVTGQWSGPVGITSTSEKFYCLNCFAYPTEGEQYFNGFISFRAIGVGAGDMFGYFLDGNEQRFESKVVEITVVGSYVTINCPDQVTLGKRFNCELNAYSRTGYWKDGIAGITTTSDLFYCENCFGYPEQGQQYFSTNITFRAIGTGSGDMYAYFSDNTTYYQSEVVFVEVTGSYIKINCPSEVDLGRRFNCEFEAFSITGQWSGPVGITSTSDKFYCENCFAYPTEGEQYFNGFISFRAITVGTGDMFAYFLDGNEQRFESKVVDVTVIGSYITLSCPEQVTLGRRFSCELNAYSKTGYWKDGVAGITTTSENFFCESCFGYPEDGQQYFSTIITFRAIGVGSGDLYAYFSDNTTLYESQVQVVEVTGSYIKINCPSEVKLGKRFNCEFEAFSVTGQWNGPVGITSTSDKFYCLNCFANPTEGEQYFNGFISFRAITVGTGDMFAYFLDTNNVTIQSKVVDVTVVGSYVTISCPEQVTLGKRFNCELNAYSSTGYWKDGIAGITTTSDLFFCENCFGYPAEGQQYFSTNITFRAIGTGTGDMYAYFSDNTTLYQSETVYIEVSGSYIKINCPAEVDLGRRFNCEFEAFSVTGQWNGPIGITSTSDKFYCLNCFANPTEGEQYFNGFISFRAITVGTGDMFAYFLDTNNVTVQSKVVDVTVVGSYITVSCPDQVVVGKRFNCELNAYSKTGYWKDGIAGITTTSDLFFCENCFGYPEQGQQYFSTNITFRALGTGTGDMYAYFSDNTTLFQSETVYIEVTGSYVTINCPAEVELGKRFNCEFEAFSVTGQWNGPIGITSTSEKFYCLNCFANPTEGEQYFSGFISFRAISVGTGDMFAYFLDTNNVTIQSKVVDVTVVGSYITISCPETVNQGQRFNCELNAYSKTGYWKDGIAGITTTSDLFFCENCFGYPEEGQQYFSTFITFRAIGTGTGDMYAYFSDNTTLYQSETVFIEVVGSYITISCPAEVALNQRFNCDLNAYSATGFWYLAGITSTSDKFYCENCFAQPPEGQQYFSAFITFNAIGLGTGDMYAYFYDGNNNYFQSKVVYIDVVIRSDIQLPRYTAPQSVVTNGSVDFTVSLSVRSLLPLQSLSIIYKSEDGHYLPTAYGNVYYATRIMLQVPISSEGAPVVAGEYCPSILITDIYGNSQWFNKSCTQIFTADCDAGFYISVVNNTVECVACPLGFYSPVPNSESCFACEPGTTSSCFAGSRSCVACSPGSSSNDGVCVKCAAGSFAAEAGQSECDPCPAGYFSETSGSSVCLPCASGSYSCGGSSNCTVCPAGTFATQHAEACTPCSSGYYAPAGSFFCMACPADTYSHAKSGECLPCPDGKHSPAGSYRCF